MTVMPPEQMQSLSLAERMREIAAEMRSEGGPEVQLQCDPWSEKLQGRGADTLVEAVVEAIDNALMHSGATRVVLSCERQQDYSMAVHVFDNGNGETPNDHAPDSGINTRIIAPINEIGGHAEIVGYPGYGTSVRLEVAPDNN